MKVLLVYPNMRGMNMLPPAIALFSAILKDRGHEIDLFDATDYPNPETVDGEADFNSDKLKEANLNVRPFDDSKLKVSWLEEDVFGAFKRKVKDFQPELLAMSATEDTFPIGVSLLKHTKNLKIPTILGGVFATFAPEVALSYSDIDVVCVGEGEHVLPELCERMENKKTYDDIPGLWVKKKDGTITKNAMAKSINIDKNPILDLSIFEKGRLYRPMQGKVWKMFPLETHRGCPYRCTYCNSPFQYDLYKQQTSSNHFRKKDFNKIRDEIIEFRDKYNVEGFYFWADTFFAYSPKEFDEFIEMYSEFKIPFWCQTRPETVTKKRVQQLIDIGLFRMAFGVEHGNEEFRRKYLARNMKNQVIIDALQIMDTLDVKYSVNNILGFPHETRKLTFDTIELNRHFFPDSTNAYSFSPFHGTLLRKIAEQNGYIEKGLIARSATKPTKLNMPQYSADQIEGMRRCFVLYVKLPKKRWPEIEKAEALTPEGDKIWKALRNEVEQTYMKTNWKDQKDDITLTNFEEMASGMADL
jgi:radical SAM superfamily enzyme YgiQ (UPF0313 family)